MAQALDTSLHERRRAERRRDPEFRAAYARAAGAIAQTDHIIRTLDELRVEMGVSKAELARRIDRNASSIRRLFTAQQARPELPLIAEIAEALGLRIAIVPESEEAKKAVRTCKLDSSMLRSRRRAPPRPPAGATHRVETGGR